MHSSVRERLTIINAFVHDVATGTWLGVLLLLTLFHFEAEAPSWATVADLVLPLERKFLYTGWASLAVIAATGVVRALTFKLFGWTGDVAVERIRLLKVKHAVLGVAFAAGSAWQAALVYAH
jgi:putative copper export protein